MASLINVAFAPRTVVERVSKPQAKIDPAAMAAPALTRGVRAVASFSFPAVVQPSRRRYIMQRRANGVPRGSTFHREASSQTRVHY